jgi:hypothetical protein
MMPIGRAIIAAVVLAPVAVVLAVRPMQGAMELLRERPLGADEVTTAFWVLAHALARVCAHALVRTTTPGAHAVLLAVAVSQATPSVRTCRLVAAFALLFCCSIMTVLACYAVIMK